MSTIYNPTNNPGDYQMVDTGSKSDILQDKHFANSTLEDSQCSWSPICGNSTLKLDIKELILKMPEKQLYDLLRIRLNCPVLEENVQEGMEDDREYWLPSYSVDRLHSEISRIVTTITVNGKKIHVNKYYNRALKIFKFISIAKSEVEFIINISDLSTRLIVELKTLDKTTVDYVLKLAVCGIFENISTERYRRLGVAKRLKVRLDR